MSTPGSTKVQIATGPQQRNALELVLASLPPAARAPLLDSLATAPPHPLGPLDALVVAVAGEQVVAACWAQPSAGRAAAYWPPQWDAQRPPTAEAVELELNRLAVQRCDHAGVAITQTLLESGDDPRIAAMCAAGFGRVAVLSYLGRALSESAPAEPAQPRLRFEPYEPRQRERLKRLLRRTYVDSLDCPAMEGARDMDDVLVGYQATGRFHPANWLIATFNNEDAGVLLLTEHPEADQIELVYMGLAPAMRGLGLGREILGKAVALGTALGAEHLMAAVDIANAPARRLYEQAGFAPWAERHVLVRRRDAENA